MLMSSGLLSIGRMTAMTVVAPVMMPDPPAPETVLPIMSIVDEVATADSRAPSSKTAIKVMKVH